MKKLDFILRLTSIVVLHGCVAEESSARETDVPEPVEAEQQALQPLPDFRIIGFNWNGTGCPRDPPGSVTHNMTQDKQTFTLYFRDMIVEHRPQGPTLQHKSCTVGVNLHVPQGWMVAIATINTRGYLDLPARVEARESSTYSFAGRPLQLSPHSWIRGPRQEDYVFTDKIAIGSMIESACGRDAILNISARMTLKTHENPAANALFTVDIIDGTLKKEFHLQWRRC
ncbi:DUF4360 domain-containing protein [Sorangium sp. So ce375]|uniref:DUF4360 domain-containing protein n=1 Tax=Sorangium sp. So ce375 TaxID=3133306 RepID=UPI003F5B2077